MQRAAAFPVFLLHGSAHFCGVFIPSVAVVYQKCPDKRRVNFFCIFAFCIMITTVMEDRLNIAFARLACLPILVVVLCFATSSAQAHARLTKSLPDSGVTLAASPARIDLWYNELLDGGDFNSITVFPSAQGTVATHTDLTAGKPTVDAKEPTHLSITLQPLPPGEYTVEWRVLSLDGHTAPGRFKFKVVAPKYQ
jgi:methionine-rich copper-binding protein CopC